MIINQTPIGTFRGEKLFVLTEPFLFYSDVLGRWVEIPVGFICDLESIPLIRGLCRTGGLIHDYLCRYDSDPIVSKKVSADVYKEALYFFEHPPWKVNGKYYVVRIIRGYFHVKSVLEIPSIKE